MALIIGLDPGPEQTGMVWLDDGTVSHPGVHQNKTVLRMLYHALGEVACEMIASYGMPVGRDVFETCVWIGRFLGAASAAGHAFHRLTRLEVKLHLCQSARAKDTNIRQALIDRYGPVGTKKTPGPLYGVTSHAWAALAVATTHADRQRP